MVCKQTIAAVQQRCGVGKTDSLAVRCANVSGGDDRDRTGDPLLAKQVLSQLSYAPKLDLTCHKQDHLILINRSQTPPIPQDRIGGPGRI